MTPNPFARRQRLGAALLRLREERGWSHAQLAAKSSVSGSVISRLEHPLSVPHQRPNLRLVRKLLAALDVPRDSPERERIETFVDEAAEGGWWESHPRMGAGQRDAAIIEAAAETIDEYAGLLLPGLVQTAEYARHRARLDETADADAVVVGRLERQRQVEGVHYRLILEEQAIHRRHGIPPEVMRDQLLHLLDLMARPEVSIRILPAQAEIGDGPAPRAPYAHVTYGDPADPAVVLVDNGTRADLVADGVERYAQLHSRLRAAAVSDSDTAALVRSVADEVTGR